MPHFRSTQHGFARLIRQKSHFSIKANCGDSCTEGEDGFLLLLFPQRCSLVNGLEKMVLDIQAVAHVDLVESKIKTIKNKKHQPKK